MFLLYLMDLNFMGHITHIGDLYLQTKNYIHFKIYQVNLQIHADLYFNVQVYAIFRNLGSTGHIDFISIN